MAGFWFTLVLMGVFLYNSFGSWLPTKYGLSCKTEVMLKFWQVTASDTHEEWHMFDFHPLTLVLMI